MGLGRAKVVEMRARVEKRIENFILDMFQRIENVMTRRQVDRACRSSRAG